MSTTRRIAYVTCDQLPDGTPDDRQTVAPLLARGVEVTMTIWNDATVDWTRFDLVVMRSPWDYFVLPREFREWLTRLESLGVRVMNPIPIIQWNMDKHYLKELAGEGVNLAPTRWAKQGEAADLGAILREEGWEKAVLKPVVSGGAFNTEKVTLETLASGQAHLDAMLRERDMMVQRYMDEINAEGEWSLLFFNNRFSHAVIKRPVAGEFRVQAHLGGQWEDRAPAADLVATAASILAKVETPLLYARVDGLIHENQFMLIELEIFEPGLFMETAVGARERFMDALLQHL